MCIFFINASQLYSLVGFEASTAVIMRPLLLWDVSEFLLLVTEFSGQPVGSISIFWDC